MVNALVSNGIFSKEPILQNESFIILLETMTSPQCCQERQTLLLSPSHLTERSLKQYAVNSKILLRRKRYRHSHIANNSGMLGILFQSPPHPSISAVAALSKRHPQGAKQWSFSWSCPLQTPPWKSPPKISPCLGLFETITLGHVLPLVSFWVLPRSTLLSLNLALLCQFD